MAKNSHGGWGGHRPGWLGGHTHYKTGGNQPDKWILEDVALLEEYVREDNSLLTPLCVVVHEPGEVCRKVEGHR